MMNRKTSIYYNVIEPAGLKSAALFLAILIFARCMPFYLWSIKDYQRVFCSIVVPIICFFNMRINKENRLYFLLFFLSFFVLGLHRDGIIKFLNAVLLCFIPMTNESFLKKTYQYFNIIFCVVLVLSIINYVLYVLGVPPLGVIKALNDVKSYDYGMFPFLVVPLDGAVTSRFCGVFDEPGVIGTLSGLMLYINRFEMKRWFNIVLLVGGILSFSLFFYAIIILAPFFLAKGTRNKVVAVGVLVIGLVVTMRNPVLYDLIGYRLMWNSDTGTFVGNTRNYVQLGLIVESERFSFPYWWGHGMAEEYTGQSSLLLFGYEQGFLFVYLNLAAYVVMAFKHIWKVKVVDFAVFVTILLASVYQRPYLFDINYIFLFTVLLYAFKEIAITNLKATNKALAV